MKADKPMNSLENTTTLRIKGLIWELTIDPDHLETEVKMGSNAAG